MVSSATATVGQTHNYKVTYDPDTGVISVWRNGTHLGNWTDSSPRTGGSYIALRTTDSVVRFDNVKVYSVDNLYYLHSDHLGSTSLMTDKEKAVVPGSPTYYYPFGDFRVTPSQTITDRGFTGHHSNNLPANDLGLIYMNARFYVPSIGRFASADTIVPNATNPQAYNRYSYGYNNPIRFTDPTGHVNCDMLGDASDMEGCNNPTPPTLVHFADESQWTAAEQSAIRVAASLIALALYQASDGEYGSPAETFLAVYGGSVEFARDSRSCNDALGYDCWASGGAHKVTFYSDIVTDKGTIDTWLVNHELGHSFNANLLLTEKDFWGEGYKNLAIEGVWANGRRLAGSTRPLEYSNDLYYIRTDTGYRGDPANPYPYRQNISDSAGEDYANMFANYIRNSFTNDVNGQARYDFMDSHMSAWISLAVSNNQ